MQAEYRTFGKTGLKVNRLGLGGAETGYGGASFRELEKLLGSAIDAGLNVIDTAECYGDGEQALGRALWKRRNEIFLFTKCGHAPELGPDWDPAGLASSIDRSLKRLRTDYVDLMQLHSCPEQTLRDPRVIEVLTRAREGGKTRFIGYSGDGADAVFAAKSGIFDTLQISISIADQEAIEMVMPAARERNIGVIVKRPLANAVWRQRRAPSDFYTRPYWDRLQELDYDFLSGDIDRSIGIALRFTLSIPGAHTAIVGTSRPGRWEHNVALASAGALPEEQYDAIRARWRAVARRDWTGQR
ncbi:MAG TPA: aldo/keto reductase [Candidatus Binataceae bacterium]